MLLRRLIEGLRTSKGSQRRWVETLDRARVQLLELGTSTEGAFLEAGARLSSILEKTQEISGRVLRVSAVVSGEELNRAMDDLAGMIHRLERFGDGAQQNEEVLRGTDRAARELESTLAGFETIVRTFRVLATLTRIESVKLSSKSPEFQALSDNVQELAGQIENRTQSMMEASSDLVRHTGMGLEKIAGAAVRQAQVIASLAGDIERGCEDFALRRASARELSGVLGERYGEVSRRMGEVVAAIQFHDITRQRLEHVAAALGDLRDRLTNPVRAAARTHPLIARAADLERNQIEGAREKFLEALDHIYSDLQAIAKEAGDISDYSKTLLESSDSSAGDFLGDMERGFKGVGAGIAKCAEVGRSLLNSTHDVLEKCEVMTRFISEMESIGMAMQMIALNTSIQTAHIGDAGAALAALAGSLQRVATQAAEQCASATERVGMLTERSRELRCAAEEQREFQAAGSNMIGKSEQVLHVLRTAHETTIGELSGIGAANADLLESIRASLRAFEIRDRFDAVTSNSVEMLQRLGAESSARTTGPVDVTADLQEFARRYTMYSERVAHLSYKSEPGTAEKESVGRDTAGAAEEDNIEWF